MRLIDAESLKAAVRAKFPALADRCEINELVNSAPTVDAVPVVHGEWFPIDPDNRGLTDEFCCSNCYRHVYMPQLYRICEYDYCPVCGAKNEDGR